MKQLSFCCPTFERFDFTVRCVDNIIDDDRIGEIIISDDASHHGSFESLEEYYANKEKVRIYRNDYNLDCQKNKYMAILHANFNYCLLIDSDNVIDENYLDKIYNEDWQPDTILTPSFAYPNFCFNSFSGKTFSKENVAQYLNEPLFTTMLNANNFFVNRQNYLNWNDLGINAVTSDSIWFCYNWFKNGGKIKVVNDLVYEHTIHTGSHYQTNVHRTPQGLHEQIIRQLSELQ